MTEEDEGDVGRLTAALEGDEPSFALLVAPHQQPLFRHCYRMLGSGSDAEDAVQESLLRAWRRLDGFDGSGTFAGWLYRIATNVCLDLLRSRKSRSEPAALGAPSPIGTLPGPPDLEHEWVEPVGVQLAGDPPDDIIRLEDISLAFVAALQRLAPRQRACLLLHDVIGFSQAEVAEALDMSAGGVNSLLFRARQAVRPRDDSARLSNDDPVLHDLLARYLDAWRLADVGAFVELVTDDIRLTMPPLVEWFDGRDSVGTFVEDAIFAWARPYGVTLRPGWCNGQPAFAVYQPAEGGALAVSGLQVLDVRRRGGRVLVTEITSYRDAGLALRCGFPVHPD